MKTLNFELKITIAYILAGGIWIMFSDKILLSFIHNPDLLSTAQTYKGWFYVIITGLVFYSYLKKHLEKLRKAEQKAKESDQLKSAFLQNLSHEIRTPMNGIIGFTELLNNEGLSFEQKKNYAQIIAKSSHQLMNLVNDILDISLIETGSSPLIERKVHLNNLLDELKCTYESWTTEEVSFELVKELPDQQSIIFADEDKLRQVLNNLLNNAFKFTEKGHIRFGYILNENELEFSVEDSGIGIPPELYELIFDRFHKADLDIAKLYEGIGLGLSICRGNVALMGGRIWVKSELGKGSSFYFTMKYNPIEPLIHPTHLQQNNDQTIQPTIILVVEDDDTSYQLIKEILGDPDLLILHAKNGREAIDIYKKNQNIRLILMDIKMPVMNGIEATREIRKMNTNVPIIVQSAFTMNDMSQSNINADFSGYIAKPFSKEQLMALVNEYCN